MKTPNKWYLKPLDGCVSGNGKKYGISLKKGTVNKLLVNFVGGGGSWNAYTAANPITIRAMLSKKESYYINHVSPLMMKLMHVGILNANDKRNPFRDWHILNIPYTTADFHMGHHEFAYTDAKGKSKVLYHRGMANVNAALGVLKGFVPETPEALVIMGLSAGGFGCVAHCPQIQALYPDCENIIIYSEAAHIHSPLWPDIAQHIWKVPSDLMAYISGADLICDLFRYAQDRMPPHTLFLHSNSVWDRELTAFMNKMNHDTFSVNAQALQEFHFTLIHAVRKMKSEIANYVYYLTDFGKDTNTGTTPHTFSGTPKLLYGKIQDGASIADWLGQALGKNPMDIGKKFILNHPA